MLSTASNVRDFPLPILDRKKKEIACLSWTSSTGDITPISFKMLDDYGVVRTFNRLRVLHSEEKRCHGITAKEFKCELIVNGFTIVIRIALFGNDLKWYLIEE
jgi:hypothetical protein